MSAPKVLCVAGSPRRGGNSDRFLRALTDGVVAAGGEPVRLVASEAGIGPCRGCNACVKTGVCIVADGMDAVYRLLDEADAIVVSSPVYFATVPATLKALYDRLQPYWGKRYARGERVAVDKRPGCLLLVGAGGDPFGTQCATATSRSALAVAGFSLDEVIEVVGADMPGDIENFPEHLSRAEEVGANLVLRAAK